MALGQTVLLTAREPLEGGLHAIRLSVELAPVGTLVSRKSRDPAGPAPEESRDRVIPCFPAAMRASWAPSGHL